MDFCEYFNNNHQNNTSSDLDAYKTYYDSYSNYLVAKKYNNNDIKTYRMNTLIDCFISMNNLDNNLREDLRKYYMMNIKDNFNRILDPPKCQLFEDEKQSRLEMLQQQYEDETDDVKQHYKGLQDKYRYYSDLLERINHPQDEQFPYDDEYSDGYTTETFSDNYEEEYDDYYDEYEYYEDDYDNDEYNSDYEY